MSLKVWIASAAIAYALLFFLVISKTGIFRLALQLVYFLPSWLRVLLSRDTRNILLETNAVYILNFPSADVRICSVGFQQQELGERCPFY